MKLFNRKTLFATSLAYFILPMIALAANNLTDVFTTIAKLATTAMELLVGLAVLVLVWGIVKYIISADDPTARAEGRSLVLWGVIGVFAIVSIWGLVNILAGTFNLNATALGVPTLPTVS